MSPTGGVPGRASGEIYVSLREYERRMRNGYAFPDNVGFIVNLPNRRSFSPDAAFYIGELKGGQFLDGASVFAAEVRKGPVKIQGFCFTLVCDDGPERRGFRTG
jgi:Uma2 family endonuclease